MSLMSNPAFVAPGATETPGDDAGRMHQILAGDLTLQVVRTAADLGLAEHAAAGPVDPAAFAAAAGLDPTATVRFLRAAVAAGLLTADDTGLFHGTGLLDTLRRDRPDSLRDEVLTMGHEMIAAPMLRLADALRSGRDQAEQALGTPFFGYLAADPGRMHQFFAAMASFTAGVGDRVVDVLDLGDARTLVDVGGADGSLARTFLRARSDLRATVLDLPHAVGTARDAADADGTGERLTTVGGDFFAEVPAADVALLKHIVHDWPDDDAVTILRNCRDAVGPAGRVVIVEQVVGEPGSAIAPLFDMLMLAVVSGRERTRAEFEALLERAGLTLRAVLRTGVANQVLEAVPSG